LPVEAFSIEGSAIGNLASQLIALGAVRDLAHFRARLREQLDPTRHAPRED
jgi:rhamnulokinase